MNDSNAAAPPAVQSRAERSSAARADVLAFLFTDIEGSSLRWLKHRVAMQSAVHLHDALLSAAIAAHGGRVFKTTGDGFYAAFARRQTLSTRPSPRSRRLPRKTGPRWAVLPCEWPCTSERRNAATTTISGPR